MVVQGFAINIRRAALIVVLAIGWGVALPGQASVCEYPATVRTPPRGSEDGSTPLEVGVLLLDLVKLDDVAQGFVADVFVRAVWRDPRLTNADGAICVVPADKIWTARAEIVNQRDLKAKWKENVRVSADGTVVYRQRYYGTLSFRSDLAEFPFDRQLIPIEVIVGEIGENLQVSADRLTGRSESMSIPNWEIGAATSKIATYRVQAAGVELPLFVVEFPAARRSIYYVFKIIIPLVLIVFMSWAVFWIHPRYIPPRLGLASTGVLTLIAFQLALGSMLPPVAYLTRLDKFVIGATVIVFVALAQAVTTAALADSGQVSSAERINRWSRLVFPLGFAASALIAFV